MVVMKTSVLNKVDERINAIVAFMDEYHSDHKFPPSVREIAGSAGLKSTSFTNWYLNKMAKEGLITREKRVSRGSILTSLGREMARQLSGKGKNSVRKCSECGAPVNHVGVYLHDSGS